MIKIACALTLLILSPLSFAKGVVVDDPYARAIPPGQTISAAFMTLVNGSDKNIDLVKASSDSAKNVELHEHIHEDGMMKMRQVPKISIAANGKTELKPGGYHIMLIDLVKHIKPQDIVTINLEFSDGSKQEIKADVRKIMMGMMKKKMSMMKFKQHVNPMPNLLAVYKKMSDKLDLSDDQKSKLDAGIKVRSPKIKELYGDVKSLEKELHEITLKGEPLNKIDQVSDRLMQARLAIIEGKTDCRESIKKVLSDKQFQQLVKLYRANMMPTFNKDKEKAAMAMMKHTNPMPNLMRVIVKKGDQLNLTEKQAAELKKWREERKPISKKVSQTIAKLEADLLEAALNNAPIAKINELADGITQNRVKIIRTKAMCRDNMKRILDDKQYKKVLAIHNEKHNKTMH